jgi:hypothetical protein
VHLRGGRLTRHEPEALARGRTPPRWRSGQPRGCCGRGPAWGRGRGHGGRPRWPRPAGPGQTGRCPGRCRRRSCRRPGPASRSLTLPDGGDVPSTGGAARAAGDLPSATGTEPPGGPADPVPQRLADAVFAANFTALVSAAGLASFAGNVPVVSSGFSLWEMSEGRSLRGSDLGQPLTGWGYGSRAAGILLDLIIGLGWARRPSSSVGMRPNATPGQTLCPGPRDLIYGPRVGEFRPEIAAAWDAESAHRLGGHRSPPPSRRWPSRRGSSSPHTAGRRGSAPSANRSDWVASTGPLTAARAGITFSCCPSEPSRPSGGRPFSLAWGPPDGTARVGW